MSLCGKTRLCSAVVPDLYKRFDFIKIEKLLMIIVLILRDSQACINVEDLAGIGIS